MDRSINVLWAKHLIKAAIDYFNERGVGACILIDNASLGDTVLAAFQGGVYGDFAICVSPGFTTRLEFGECTLIVAIRVDNADHILYAPYHTVRAVMADTAPLGAVNAAGQINVVSIPPVVYPPGSSYRDSPPATVTTPMEPSDPQVALPLVVKRS